MFLYEHADQLGSTLSYINQRGCNQEELVEDVLDRLEDALGGSSELGNEVRHFVSLRLV